MKYSNLPTLGMGIAIVALVSACAQTRVMTLAPAPLDLLDSGFPVELASSHVVVDRHGNVVAGAGEGAGLGMAAGAGGSILGGASTGNPLGLALGIVLAPAFAVGGGIYGAAAAHPADETEAAVAAIERVYSDQELLGALAGEVESRLPGLGFRIPPPCTWPPGHDSPAASAGDGCLPVPSNRLRLTVAYAFTTEGAYSPDLRFGIDVEGTATKADRAGEAEAFRWVYLSPELDFFAATENEAAVLRSAIADAHERLAGRIVDDLFLARREEKIAGTYFPDTDGINFRPAAITPGIAVRVPTKSELVDVPEASLAK
jgi:hypothetical protein